MTRSVITPARPVRMRVRPRHFLLAGVVAIAAAGAVTALPGDDAPLPAKPSASPVAPISFGDPPALKGAHAADAEEMTAPLFADPVIRKGAAGR
jgi:hypothetical protein